MSELTRSNRITAYWQGEGIAVGVFYKTHTKIKEVHSNDADVLAASDLARVHRRICGTGGGVLFRYAVVYEAQAGQEHRAHFAQRQQQAALWTQDDDSARAGV